MECRRGSIEMEKASLLILPCLPGVILQLGDLKTGSPGAINTADVHQRTPNLG